MFNRIIKNTDKYFTNIGTKLKNLAKWSFVVEAIACFISAFIGVLYCFVEAINSYYPGDYFLGAFGIILGLPLVVAAALVANWPLYAFGELVERVCNMDDQVALLTLPVRDSMADTIEAAEEAARQAAEEAAAEEARQIEEARAKRKAQMEAMSKNANNMAKQAKQAAGSAAKQAKQAANSAAKELNRRKEEEKARKEALQNYNPAEEAARHKEETISRQEAEENARRIVEERMRRKAEEKAMSTAESAPENE